MRILFMGTPDFACPSLEALYRAGHEICGVFTQPDKPKNRGMQMVFPPVKELALSHGTAVYQPETLRDSVALEHIRALAPELIVVVAYGKILPQEILDLPPHGCINVHASLLPKYRGAAPIQWAVLNGERVTGVTIMQMDVGLDTGDSLTVRETEILPDETAGQLFTRLSHLGAELLADTIPAIADGTAQRTPQNHEKATHAPPLNRGMSPVDWTRSATEIVNQVRGLNPWPMATTIIGAKTFKLHTAHVGANSVRPCSTPTTILSTPGTILSTGSDGLEIACGDGSVIITTLQAPGKRAMSAADYLRGNPIA
ncbi:MAG: methionyl-tRNA formyltransferase [Oscillospiraceae bacterium]|nr:methionyl-tRNA formyltransferase [Oscillospiraceae bacterium]